MEVLQRERTAESKCCGEEDLRKERVGERKTCEVTSSRSTLERRETRVGHVNSDSGDFTHVNSESGDHMHVNCGSSSEFTRWSKRYQSTGHGGGRAQSLDRESAME